MIGDVDEGRICVFRHGVRNTEGDSREWWVCLLEAPRVLNPAGLEGRAAPPFEVEAQVRGPRLAVSLAGRNDPLDSADDVASFVAYTRSLARRLESTTR